VTDGHGIHVFQIPSHGNAEGDSRKGDAFVREEFGKEGHRGFSFGGWVHGQDHFFHLLLSKAHKEFGNFQVFGTDSIQGGKKTVQDVVPPFEKTGFLNRELIARPFDDADDAIAPGFVAADGARVLIGEVKAQRTKSDFFLLRRAGFEKGLQPMPWAS
jgi:hypothetical protein